ncbi:MAG: hypothetical protein IJ572_03755 [Bacilli bacterium]|nr:hypothetical protein [Bacilli bacterium]
MDEKVKHTKRNVILYVSVLVLLLCITYGFSYAYFSVGIDGNDRVYQTVINAGNLELGFIDSQTINAQSIVFIGEDEVAAKSEKNTFDVKNIGNVDASYELNVNVIEIDKLNHEDFKWELLIDGVSRNSGNFANVVSGDSITITPNKLDLSPNSKNSFELRVWLQDANRNQIDLLNGSFRATVSLSAVNK